MNDKVRLLLIEIAAQLEKWAVESVSGGWSTHQVRPMRDLAFRIVIFIEEHDNAKNTAITE